MVRAPMVLLVVLSMFAGVHSVRADRLPQEGVGSGGLELHAVAYDIHGRPADGILFVIECNHNEYAYQGGPLLSSVTLQHGYCWTGMHSWAGSNSDIFYPAEPGQCRTHNGFTRFDGGTKHEGLGYVAGDGHFYRVTSCSARMASPERAVDWKREGIETHTEVDLGVWSGRDLVNDLTFNAVTHNVIPAPDHVFSDPALQQWVTQRGQSMLVNAEGWLFQSGPFDHPIVLLDGWDPTNLRGAYEMYDPFMRLMYQAGIDVVIVNYGHGAQSLRRHIDESAVLLSQIQAYQGLGRIDVVVGISQGGMVGRAALAAMEHLQRAGAQVAPAWLAEYAASPERVAEGHHVRALISWDSPQEGLVGVPIDLQLMLRKMMELSRADMVAMCEPKGGFLKFLAGLGAILRFIPVPIVRLVGQILGPLAQAAVRMREGMITKGYLKMRAASELLADKIDPLLNGGPTRDLFLDYCTSKDPGSCSGALGQAFRNDVAALNGDGWPRQARLVAFAQGTFAPHHCDWPDQWGPGTCSGPAGLYDTPEGRVWKPAGERSWPNEVLRNFVAGDRFFFADLPSACKRDVELRIRGNDAVAGSVTDVLVRELTSLPGASSAYFDFLPAYQNTTSALAMASEGSPSRFHDVLWQDFAYTHQDISPDSYHFMLRYIWEYTWGDGDGSPACTAIPGWPVAPGVPAGKLVGCDPDDTSQAVTASLDWRSAPDQTLHLPTPPLPVLPPPPPPEVPLEAPTCSFPGPQPECWVVAEGQVGSPLGPSTVRGCGTIVNTCGRTVTCPTDACQAGGSSGSSAFSASNTGSATSNTQAVTIEVAAGATLEAGTCPTLGGNGWGDTYLRLFFRGQEVAASDDSCGLLSQISYTAREGGSYELRLGCYSGSACGGTVAWHTSSRPVCGNGVCDGGEACGSCPADCGVCGPYCGDNMCSEYAGENGSTCPRDCPNVCGDGWCFPGETCSSCPAECGPCEDCGDGACTGSETSSTCSQDCGPPPPACGDGSCNGSESSWSCSQDCGPPPPWCGDGSCNADEGCASCAIDCGACVIDSQAVPVVWTSPVGVVVEGNGLRRTTSGYGFAGAVSSQVIAAGSGYVELTAGESESSRMIGLSHGNPEDVDYALYLAPGGTLNVYERGGWAGQGGSYGPGDRLRVAVVGGLVTYSKNGVPFLTSGTPATYPLAADARMLSQGSTVSNVVIAGAVTP